MTPEELQAARDREAIFASLPDLGRPLVAAADVGTLPIRGLMGAFNSLLRLPNAAGAGIPYIPEAAFGGSSTSLTPYYDRFYRGTTGAADTPKQAIMEQEIPGPAAKPAASQTKSKAIGPVGTVAQRTGLIDKQVEDVMAARRKAIEAGQYIPNERKSEEEVQKLLEKAAEAGKLPEFSLTGKNMTDAVLQMGLAALGGGGKKGAFGALAKGLKEGDERDRADAKERRSSVLQEGAMLLGARDKDFTSAEARRQAEAQHKGAMAGVDTFKPEQALALRLQELKDAQRMREINAQTGDRSPSLNSIAGAEWLLKNPQAAGLLGKGRDAKPGTLEDADAVKQAIISQYGIEDPNNPEVQRVLQAAYMAVLSGAPVHEVMLGAKQKLGR